MKYQTYRNARRNGLVPAGVALDWARGRRKPSEAVDRLQFAWLRRNGQCDEAFWRQDGFDLEAKVVDDPDGWFGPGVDVYGAFGDRRQPGAVRHWVGDRRSYRWFIPADPEHRHRAYRRACDYGHRWHYVGIRVTASKQGVRLATESLWGIESDSDIDCFTRTALELGARAVTSAQAKLRELCGGICP